MLLSHSNCNFIFLCKFFSWNIVSVKLFTIESDFLYTAFNVVGVLYVN